MAARRFSLLENSLLDYSFYIILKFLFGLESRCNYVKSNLLVFPTPLALLQGHLGTMDNKIRFASLNSKVH